MSLMMLFLRTKPVDNQYSLNSGMNAGANKYVTGTSVSQSDATHAVSSGALNLTTGGTDQYI